MTDYLDVTDDVRPMIADLLGVDDEEVTPEASFERDLGGESIDYLDLTFRVEQKFGVRVDFKDLFDSQDIATDEAGRLLPDALTVIQRKLPLLDLSLLGEDAGVSQVRELVTVAVLTQIIQQAVDAARVATVNQTPTSRLS